jgi:hypothetical protein
VDPHHLDADLDVDPDSTYQPYADPDYDFNLMRIQVTKMMRIRIPITACLPHLIVSPTG